MPSKRVEKKIRRRRLFITLSMVIICIGIMIGVALKTDYFLIENIIVENNLFVSDEDIIVLSQVKNENIFTIKKETVEQRILNNPYIDSITLIRKLPNTLVINIKEKSIRGLVKFQGSFINIDNEGRMVHIVNKFPDGKLPLIEGINIEQFVQNERLIKGDPAKEKALKAVLEIPRYKECEGLFYSINIENPYSIILTTVNNIKVNIGDYLDTEYKLGFAVTLLNNSELIANKNYIEVFSDGTAITK